MPMMHSMAVRARCPNRSRRLVAAAIVLFCLAGTLARAQTGLSALEERGRRIYHQGVGGSSTAITADVSGARVQASVLPCASCHGADGRGRPEGGVTPSNITWDALAREVSGGERRRPVYTEKSLRRAVTMGLDPGGKRLGAAMPRFAMAADDMNALIAYIKVLGRDHDAGLTDTTINVGLLYAAGGSALDRALEAVVVAYFRSVNERGGIYGRRVVPGLLSSDVLASDGFSGSFALVGGLSFGDEDTLGRMANAARIPAVGLLATAPESRFDRNRYAFYLFPGLARECEELARAVPAISAAEGSGGTAVVRGGGPLQTMLARSFSGELAGATSGAVVEATVADPADIVRTVNMLADEKIATVLFLGPAEHLPLFLRTVAARAWRPRVMMPSALAAIDPYTIPSELDGRVYLSFPAFDTMSRAGASPYEILRRTYGLTDTFDRNQRAAYAGARLLVEALIRCGRDLTRERLVATLESLYEFDTGVMPPVTFGPNRRVACTGIQVASVDLVHRRLAVLRP